MTKPKVSALALLSKTLEGTQGDFLKPMLLTMVQAVMGAEADAVCGAEYGERSDERTHQRKGYRSRTLSTRMGDLDLQIPKLRTGTTFSSFLEARGAGSRPLSTSSATTYVLGVSTRKVEDLVEAMGAPGVSKSTVSRMASELDEQAAAFRKRPLDKPCPCAWLDANYIKVREAHRVVSKAVLVA